MKKIALLILFITQFLISCKKQRILNDCSDLKDGIINNNINKVRSEINNIIFQLPSQDYSEQNLSNLVQKISVTCSISSEVRCFNCIRTLPSQTEVYVKLPSAGSTIERIIDITYTAANSMTFSNMHN